MREAIYPNTGCHTQQEESSKLGLEASQKKKYFFGTNNLANAVNLFKILNGNVMRKLGIVIMVVYGKIKCSL